MAATRVYGSDTTSVKIVSTWTLWHSLELDGTFTSSNQEYGLVTSGSQTAGLVWTNTGTIKQVDAGTWKTHSTLRKFGGGTKKVRVLCQHYDSDYNLLRTITNVDQTLSSGTVEYEHTGTPGSFTIAVGEFIAVGFRNTSLSGTQYMKYGQDVAGYDSLDPFYCWVEIPNWTEITPVVADEGVFYLNNSQASKAKPEPVCQWDTEPFQVVEQNTTFTAGIDAYCKGGIEKVVIVLTPSSGNFTGTSPYTFPNVTEQTINPLTNLPSYNVDIPASWFSANTSFTLAGTVHANNGSKIDASSYTAADDGFEDIDLYVDQDGTTVRGDAWVHSSGQCSDTGGIVQRGGAKPLTKKDWYATAADAIEQLKAWMLVNAGSSIVDGCRVFLSDETHAYARNDSTLHSNSYAWLTITNEDGATPIISGAPGVTCPYVPLTSIEGDITIGPTIATILSMIVGTNRWRFKDLTIVGSSRTDQGPLWDFVSANKVPQYQYFNNNTIGSFRVIINTDQNGVADKTIWAQNNNFATFMDDVVGNCRYFVGNVVSDTNPAGSGVHTDINKISTNSSTGKYHLRPMNILFAHNKCYSDVNYLGFFIRGEAVTGRIWDICRRWACVNNILKVNARPLNNVGNHEHLLLWCNHFLAPTNLAAAAFDYDNTFGQQFIGSSFMGEGTAANVKFNVEYPNLSVQGNIFSNMTIKARNKNWLPSGYQDDTSDSIPHFLCELDENDFDNNCYYAWWVDGQVSGVDTYGTNKVLENPLLDVEFIPNNPTLVGRFAAPVKYDINMVERPALATVGPVEGVPVVPKDIDHRDYRKRKTTECPF